MNDDNDDNCEGRVYDWYRLLLVISASTYVINDSDDDNDDDDDDDDDKTFSITQVSRSKSALILLSGKKSATLPKEWL